MTTVRLAVGGIVSEARHFRNLTTPPGILVSYYYLKGFSADQQIYNYRDWVMDSGAYSAWSNNAVIDLDEYIEKCKELLAIDPTLKEVYALDVIGDWQASKKNVEKMWNAGVPAIPCFHMREPESLLLHYAKDYPKIAFGGMVGTSFKQKNVWAKAMMSKVWPKKVHGFGLGSESTVLSIPFHSVDSTNWLAPQKFGSRFKNFRGKISLKPGSNWDLSSEIEWFVKLEERARHRWAKQMKELDDLG